MAACKRIVITDEKAVKALNLIAAVRGEDATEIATDAVLALWQEEGNAVLEKARQLSPIAGHDIEAKDDKETGAQAVEAL